MIKRYLNELLLQRQGLRKRRQEPNPILDWPTGVVSSKMGCDRGTPIDRIYIERFIKKNKNYIQGTVMEIGDRTYTDKYAIRLKRSLVLTADKEYVNQDKDIHYGDLQTGEGCGKDFLDCFILTQTLPFVYDIQSAAKNIMDMLRPGGVALLTVSGISMISKYDDCRWGHYWGLTETSIKRIFQDYTGGGAIRVISMGNSKTAAAFIYGLAAEELKKQDFETDDPLIPLVLGVIVEKATE